jgi:hypothetical protein
MIRQPGIRGRRGAALFVFGVLMTARAVAGADASIDPKLRAQIQTSMREYLKSQTVNGVVLHYDPIENKVLRLQPGKIHEGVTEESGFYVSCVDFVDQTGRKLDLDLLVRPEGKKFVTTQAVVHAVDGVKRAYQLESQ